jgi:predicted transcriptional regulator
LISSGWRPALKKSSEHENAFVQPAAGSGRGTADAAPLTAGEVQERLPEAPSYSAVRALLKILENKGHVLHVQEGPRYVYRPAVPREKVRRSALDGFLHTFFEGSAEKAVAALLDLKRDELSEDDLDRISGLIEKAREEGR